MEVGQADEVAFQKQISQESSQNSLKKNLKRKSNGTEKENKKKSKHQKMMQSRVEGWSKQPQYSLTIESLIHPICDEEKKTTGCLLSMRQFQPHNDSKSKKAFGDMIILDSSNID